MGDEKTKDTRKEFFISGGRRIGEGKDHGGIDVQQNTFSNLVSLVQFFATDSIQSSWRCV